MEINENNKKDDVSSENIEVFGEGELPEVEEHGTREHHGNHSHSHRSRHSHHRYRKRASKKRKDGKNKFFKFLKKNRSLLVNIFACTLVVILLIIIAVGHDNGEKIDDPVQASAEYESSIRLEIPLYSEEVCLVGRSVEEYLEDETGITAHEVWGKYKGDINRLDSGVPFEFTYRVVGKPDGVSIESTTLEISENDSYEEPLVYDLDGENKIDIYNLKTGTDYYYRLNLALSDGSEVGAVGTFKTADTPRLLNIEGIVNARDIGGWETTDGRVVRQGLLFRGSELDGLVEARYCLTDAGRDELLTRLGVSFDMDLRSNGDNPEGTDALGSEIEHVHYGAPSYSELMNKEISELNNETIRKIFSDLADKNNYPIYMHCTYGRDRTGTICYLLEALLGVSDDDLKRDYEMSAFADLEEFGKFTTHIEYMGGDTTQEKVEGYLLSVGVTVEEIANIREIFLGE